MALDPPPNPDAPDGSGDNAARADALRTIATQLGIWSAPVAIVSVLCLLLGVPWWLVAGGVALFLGIILFEA